MGDTRKLTQVRERKGRVPNVDHRISGRTANLSRRGFLKAATAATAAAGALAAGCRRAPTAARPGEVVLNFYTTAASGFHDLYKKVLIPAFEREHEGIRVNIVFQFDQAGYDSKLLMMMAGGMAPDVFHCVQENFPNYAARDILLPLDEFANHDPEFPMGEMYTRVVDAMRDGRGQLVGLPSDFSTIVMFYNKELFDRQGVGPPNPNWTWDEFFDVCRRLTVPPHLFATSNSDAYNRWPAWVWMNGGDIFTPDMSRCTMDTPEAIGGIKFYADLSARHRVARTPGGSGFGLSEYELFAAQKTAVYPGSRYAYKMYLESMPLKFEWDCVPLPRGPAGLFTTFIWGGNCVLKTTKHPRESWELVKFLTGPRGAELTMAGGNGIAPHRPTTERFVANPTQPRTPANDKLFLYAIDYARQARAPKRYPMFADANLSLRSIFDARMSAEAGCRRYTDLVNEILRGARV